MFSYGAVCLVDMNNKDAGKAEKITADLIPQEGLSKFLQLKLGVTKEVAMKVFSDLGKLLARGTEAFEKIHKQGTDSNDKSQEDYMDHESFVARVHAEQLKLEALTPEERASIRETLEKSAERAYAKDSENKAFVLNLFKLAGKGILTALALAIVVLAVKESDKGPS
jgi:hypothetical protein